MMVKRHGDVRERSGHWSSVASSCDEFDAIYVSFTFNANVGQTTGIMNKNEGLRIRLVRNK